MKHRKNKTKYIVILILLFVLIPISIYRYSHPPIKDVVNLTTSDGKKIDSVDNIYLKYQLRLSQFIMQTQNKIDISSVNEKFWSEITKNNFTREEILKDELLDSTKNQLIIIQYAKENNITLDADDVKKVDELLSYNSSKKQIDFISDKQSFNEKIYRKIFENLVLSEKALKIGAEKESPPEINSDETKVIICEELNIDIANNKLNTALENIKIASKLADKVYSAAKNHTFKELSKEFNVSYKDNVDITSFGVDNNSENIHIIDAVKKLKKGEYTKPLKLYSKNKTLSSFLILKYLQLDDSSSDKNNSEQLQMKKLENFKNYLLNKKENQDFDINKELFNELK